MKKQGRQVILREQNIHRLAYYGLRRTSRRQPPLQTRWLLRRVLSQFIAGMQDIFLAADGRRSRCEDGNERQGAKAAKFRISKNDPAHFPLSLGVLAPWRSLHCYPRSSASICG
jgi:predicted DNA-binding protein